MHHHFADMFNGLEFGAAERVLFAGPTSIGPSNPTTPAPATPQPDAPEPVDAPPAEPKPETPDVADGPNGPRDAVGGAQKIEAGKPGALPAAVPNTPETKDAVQKTVDDGVINEEEKKTLTDGSKSEVLANVKHDAEGWLDDSGRQDVHADNLDRVASENHDTARKNLEDAKAAGITDPDELTDLTERIGVADKAEGEIVETVKNRQKLIGANEAEIVQLDATRSPEATAWKDENAAKYKAAIETTQRFHDAGGQVYEPDVFGDDWDTEKDWSFETIAGKYSEDPERWKNDFKSAQGDGTSTEDRKRRSEATKLLTALEEYSAAKAENTEVDGKIEDRRDRIGDITKEIETDVEHLSGDRRGKLSGPGIDPAPAPTAPKPADPKPGEHAVNSPGELAKPENRQKLIDEGTKAGVIPANVSFNDQGQAVYTVQDTDTLWSITEKMNHGKFDANIWQSMANSNPQVFDRTGSPDLINQGDQIVVPWYSQLSYAQELQKAQQPK